VGSFLRDPVVLVTGEEDVDTDVTQCHKVPIVAVRRVHRQRGVAEESRAAGKFGHLGSEEDVPVCIVFDNESELNAFEYHAGGASVVDLRIGKWHLTSSICSGANIQYHQLFYVLSSTAPFRHV
jgi:hypothetical protein